VSVLKRNTKQREVIAACFETAKRPLSPAEAHALATKAYPSLGIATVYRAVNDLVSRGVLTSICIGGTTRFEPSSKVHHHHFYCRDCQKVFCLEDCPVSKTALAPKGYKVEGHVLVVNGICKTCAQGSQGQ
jgi:Fur family transcriptional regulator, ferric uptake regulator